MADDLPLSQDNPVEDREERAVAFAERAADRAGLAPDPEPDRGSTGVATAENEPSGPGPQQFNLPDPDAAHRSWQDRRRQERERREAQAAQEEVQRLIAALESEGRSGAAATAPATEEDPEPDPEVDFRAWSAWRDRQLQNQILQAMDQRFSPFLSAFEQEQQLRQQRAEEAREVEIRRQGLARRAQLAGEASREYMATEEGRGFPERLAFRFGDPGDREHGLEPIDGVEALGLMAAGLPADLARQIALGNARALAEIFAGHGLNPAVAMDRFNRALIVGSLQFAGAYQQQGAQPAPRPAPTPAAREVAQLRQTAQAAGSVAGTGADGGGAPGAPDVAKAARSGHAPSMEQLRELAKKKYGGDKLQLARELRRLARTG